MPSDFRQNGDNHEQLNIYYTSIIVKTRNKYNKFSKKPIKLPSISLPARIKKQYFFTKNLRFQKISLPLQSHFGKVHSKQAEIAQLVEHDLAKVGVASSSLVFRSRSLTEMWGFFVYINELSVLNMPLAHINGNIVFCLSEGAIWFQTSCFLSKNTALRLKCWTNVGPNPTRKLMQHISFHNRQTNENRSNM